MDAAAALTSKKNMNQRTPMPQPGVFARSARALFFAAHLAAFKLVSGLVVLALSVASLAALFDGPDIARAAQSGITLGPAAILLLHINP